MLDDVDMIDDGLFVDGNMNFIIIYIQNIFILKHAARKP